MNDLQEQLACTRIEYKDGAIDGLSRQVTFERLVNGDSVDVGVVDEQLSLIAEQLGVVLRVQELLGTLRGVQLQALPDTFTKDVQCRIGLHDFGHSLLDQCFQAWKIGSIAAVEIVGEINANHQPSCRGIDTHTISSVIKIFGSHVSLDVMGVVIAISKLDVQPKFVGGGRLDLVFRIEKQRGSRNIPFVARKEKDVGAGGVHLVRLSRMNCLFLNRFNAELLEFLVENLT